MEMDVKAVFDLLPLSEKTLLRRIRKGLLFFVLKNDGGHPCEYYLKDDNDENIGMIKYYRGRKLAYYKMCRSPI